MDNTLKTQIRESRKLLQNPYAYLDGDGDFTAIPNNWSGSVHSNLRDLQNPYAFVHNEDDYSKPVSPDTVNRRQYVIDPSPLLGKTKKGGRLSDREIELIARNLQNEMWRHQLDLFPDRQILNPVDIIDPIVALASIGYRTGWSDSLGEYSIEGESVEVAGTIDRSAQVVRISRRFSPEMGVPPKLIIFNGFLVGAGAQHCQGQIRQRDRFATTMTIPTRNGDFGATRAGSEWPAPRAHSTACPNA